MFSEHHQFHEHSTHISRRKYDLCNFCDFWKNLSHVRFNEKKCTFMLRICRKPVKYIFIILYVLVQKYSIRIRCQIIWNFPKHAVNFFQCLKLHTIVWIIIRSLVYLPVHSSGAGHCTACRRRRRVCSCSVAVEIICPVVPAAAAAPTSASAAATAAQTAAVV